MTASLLPVLGRPRVRPPLRSTAADVLVTLAAVVAGGTIALWWSDESGSHTSVQAVGRLAGLLGTLSILGLVGMIARIPWLERQVGQDVLLQWHRKLAPYALLLVGAHVLLITVGYAEATNTNPVRQFWTFLTSYPDMLKAVIGFALFIGAGFVSWKRLRRLVKYETWWASHLLTYLAAFLVFGHQFANGNSFVNSPAASSAWKALYIGVFAIVIWCRLLVPIVRSLRHNLRVAHIEYAADGIVHVVMTGRSLDRLAVRGGQFLQFRFLAPGQWWQAHPYSTSAVPRPNALRISVQLVGDSTRALTRMMPGTRVWIEGPYGAFTTRRATTNRLALIAGGIGITPIRSLVEELPAGSQPVVLYRVRKAGEIIMQAELDRLVADRGGLVYYLVGPRGRQPISPQRLAQLVPDITHRELFICGSRDLVRDSTAAARALGLDRRAIHAERFDFE